jgi:hypothetical protein
VKPSELFGVVVRTIGFLVMLYGLYDLLSGFDNFFENLLSGGSDSDSASASASTLSYFVLGVPGFIVGVLCFSSLPAGLSDWPTAMPRRKLVVKTISQ